MKIRITDEMGNEKEIEIGNISGKDLLKHLGISAFEAIIMKNGEIVRESEILTKNDRIKIINVIYGG